MKKQTIIFIILLILLGIMSVRNAKAEAPLADTSVPLEVKDNPIKKFAYNQVRLKWGESQWESFNSIVNQESWDWRITEDHYPTGYTKTGVRSSAYGLCGFLNSTWKDTGYKKSNDPQVQISACILYIENRYNDPDTAWKFHKINNWY